MTEQRYTDSHPDRRSHCDNHTEHHSDISKNTDAIERNTNSITGIVSSMGVLKWVIGLGLPIFIGIFTFAASMVNNKMEDITSELKDIKSAVNSIALDQVQVKAELESVKWRLDQLEAR